MDNRLGVPYSVVAHREVDDVCDQKDVGISLEEGAMIAESIDDPLERVRGWVSFS